MVDNIEGAANEPLNIEKSADHNSKSQISGDKGNNKKKVSNNSLLPNYSDNEIDPQERTSVQSADERYLQDRPPHHG